MSLFSLQPSGFQTMGVNNFSSLSLGNTSVSTIPTNQGGFTSFLSNLSTGISADNDPMQNVLGIASKLPVVGDVIGAVSGFVDFIGGIFGGVDFEKDVKPKIINRTKNRIGHAKGYYLGDNSLEPALRLTKADAYLSWTIHWIKIDRNKRLKSAAWKKGYDMWVQMLEEWLKQLRTAVSQEFNVSVQTKDVRGYNIINHLNEPAKYPHGSNIPHGIYTKKTAKEIAVVQRQNGVPLNGNTPSQTNKSSATPLIALAIGFLLKKQIGRLIGVRL